MTNKYITGLATLVVIFSMTLSSLAKSPLIEAAKDNEWDKVKQLIEAGADVNLHDKWKMTPLHIAATQGNFAMVKWLIQHRADVNAQDFDGKTPWFRWEMAGITNLEVARNSMAAERLFAAAGSREAYDNMVDAMGEEAAQRGKNEGEKALR